ncbi:hypothetical protein EDD15DRAFT_301149 [Pisolithus albus]|nr:hypothetical protein EDD15DRAFT_301149 [Pisolithus albus]
MRLPHVTSLMSSATDSETIINDYIEGIRPAFVILITNTAFSSSLFTLLVVLLALSTKESRRRVVFRLNVLAICIVLTMAVLVGYGDGKIVLNEIDQLSTALYIASMALTVFPPLLSDSILLTRLFALYPLASTSLVTLLKIFAFPFCVKCARIVVLTFYLKDYSTALITGNGNPWYRNPNLIAEWAMQIADNTYSVTLFLYNLRLRTSSMKRGGMPARIRQIFYISAANFVFPLLFNIVLIICIATVQSFDAAALLLLINNYVTVMGVLCATVWFSRSEWVRSRNEPLSDNLLSPEPSCLRKVHDAERTFGSETAVSGKESTTFDMQTWTLDR